MNIRAKIMALILVLFNFCLVWLTMKIADFSVSLQRLNEFSGYMMTEEEERFSFYWYSTIMFIMQAVCLRFVWKFLNKRRAKKVVFLMYVVVSVALYVWFLFSVYAFTINGDSLHRS